MKTGMIKLATFGVAGFVAGVLALGSTALAGEPKVKGGAGGEARGQKLLDGDFDQRIENHIKRIEEAIANHPNMPAEVKAELEKIVADLKVKKADLDKLVVDLKAKNKEAVQADRAKVRADIIQLMKDRLPLIDAHIARLEGRLAKHPNAPAAIKAAFEKLIADLKDRKVDLEKLINDFEAKDKAAVKADRAELKADHQQIVTDRKTLRELIRANRGAGKGK